MTPETTAETARTCGVLVADDDEEIRSALDGVLSQAGFSVWLASDGREALDVYRSHGAAIDVMLLDVCMPELDGPETLAAIHEVAPHVPCCFMSGYLGIYKDSELRLSSGAAVFEKPFRVSELIEALRELAPTGRRTADNPPTAPYERRGLRGDPSGNVARTG